MAHNLIVNYGLCDPDEQAISNGKAEPAAESEEAGMDVDGPLHTSVDATGAKTTDAAEDRVNNMLVTGARGKMMQVFRARRANKNDMTKFHTDEYIDFLEKVTPETCEALTGGGVRCEFPVHPDRSPRGLSIAKGGCGGRMITHSIGLIGEDCPPFEGLWEFCSISAGGSIGEQRFPRSTSCIPVSCMKLELTQDSRRGTTKLRRGGYRHQLGRRAASRQKDRS